MKKLWEKIKPFVETVKAARMAVALWVMFIGYMGYNETNRPLPEPVIEEQVVVENVEADRVVEVIEPVVVKQKDWLPIIKKEINKAIREVKYDFHGGEK